MSKNIILNGKAYEDVSNLAVETAEGGTARFRETSEIIAPAGTLEIGENGTFDVTNFAQALVAVVCENSGNVRIERGDYQADEDTYTITISAEASKRPLMAFAILDETSVETFVSAKCYAAFCYKDRLGVFVKSTSSGFYGTSATTTDGTNAINAMGEKVVINSPVKLYGGTYNFVAVYEDVEA